MNEKDRLALAYRENDRLTKLGDDLADALDQALDSDEGVLSRTLRDPLDAWRKARGL